MGSKVERSETGALMSITFSCDHEGCPAAPTDSEIVAAGGLTKMGWECPGGKHYCPEHRLTPLPGLTAIAEERRRQIEIEGWTPAGDIAKYSSGELAQAAACYALGRCPPGLWPWAAEWFKPGTPQRNLEKAGALVAAELDRISGGGIG